MPAQLCVLDVMFSAEHPQAACVSVPPPPPSHTLESLSARFLVGSFSTSTLTACADTRKPFLLPFMLHPLRRAIKTAAAKTTTCLRFKSLLEGSGISLTVKHFHHACFQGFRHAHSRAAEVATSSSWDSARLCFEARTEGAKTPLGDENESLH